MRVQKFGHSCLLVQGGDTRMLVDPGTFSTGFEDLRDLDVVLVTHVHGDHLDVDRLDELLTHNPDAQVVCDQDSAAVLRRHGLSCRVVHDGDRLDLGLPVSVHGREHAVIHRDIPRVANVGYLIDGRLFHPGDAFTVPPHPVEILAVPAGAPWMRIAEAIDYLRQIAPAVAIPVHECVLAVPGMAYRHLDRLSPERTRLAVLDEGAPVDL